MILIGNNGDRKPETDPVAAFSECLTGFYIYAGYMSTSAYGTGLIA